MHNRLTLTSWEAFKQTPIPEQPFTVDPIIPRPGITLLHGKTGRGKTPFTWELARCGATGTSFFGMSTTAGHVLYIEVDTPMAAVRARMEPVPTAPDVHFIFSRPFDILSPTHVGTVVLRKALLQVPQPPTLVIVNTLRKVYFGEEKDGAIPSQVYDKLLEWFPGAAVVVVHHDKKDQIVRKGDKAADSREAFSGHQAWLNDAQSSLHLCLREPEQDDDETVLRLALRHTKNQVGPQRPQLNLRLDDGWRWSVDTDEVALRILRAADEIGVYDSKMTLYAAIGTSLRKSPRQVQRLIKEHRLETALFGKAA